MKNQTQTVVLLGLLLTLAVVHESGAFTAGIGNMGMSGKRDLTKKTRRELQLVCHYVRSTSSYKRSGERRHQTPLYVREICGGL
ncbi:hypothetical protein OS493_008505 [Desmophyllum pertusum]|uniref:Uncharacterized protein n=1 Tax=Desmophyllum pertusum TaxID=174260 RepID=A0A9X0D3X2_9CNID|nr:hypothetical protein OS493_008505 [Desmophyllum pertusum]